MKKSTHIAAWTAKDKHHNFHGTTVKNEKELVKSVEKGRHLSTGRPLLKRVFFVYHKPTTYKYEKCIDKLSNLGRPPVDKCRPDISCTTVM
jgi:hypothetical protein